MDIITDSVNKLEEILCHSGCEESDVCLDVDPDAKTCEYERGACMVATFGGRMAEFVTDNPVRAMTKISYMFGTPLEAPAARSAACSVINAVTGFFCISRVLHSCPVESHAACLRELMEKISGHRVFCVGKIHALEREQNIEIVSDIHEAEFILVNNEGLIALETSDLIASVVTGKKVIFLGPSTSGIARLQQHEHWCPYGMQKPANIPDPSR
ncbi:MAG TPA: hypothetical protein PKM50_00200 [Methanoregula sp.]|nr:hypothetical protein [Methanoregula sp.]